MTNPHGPLRVGVGGPVGTGKTALMDALCRTFAPRYDVAAITNDIYTKEDAEFLTRAGSLPPERILGIETGGCPHTAIREDASINLAGVADLRRRFPALDVILIESGGDNLAATFSPELADLTIYVIDVSAGDKIPRKGGPGITRSDLLVINKTDLAPHVGASLEVMDRDSRRMRGERPFVFANIRAGAGVPDTSKASQSPPATIGTARCRRTISIQSLLTAACVAAAVVHCRRRRRLTAVRQSARPMASRFSIVDCRSCAINQRPLQTARPSSVAAWR